MEFRSSAPGEGQEACLQPPRRTLGSAARKEDDEPPKIVATGLATPGADVEKKRKADAKNKKAKVQMKMSGKTGFELDENGNRLITMYVKWITTFYFEKVRMFHEEYLYVKQEKKAKALVYVY